MEITKVLKPFVRRGLPNTFGNIVNFWEAKKVSVFWRGKLSLIIKTSFTHPNVDPNL